MNSESMRATLRTTKALSDIQRLRILLMLRAGELCVCRIVAVLELAPSTVSKHLSLLRDAGLLDCRKDGRWAYYRLPQGEAFKAVKPVLKWLEDALGNEASVLADAEKVKTALSCAPEGRSRRYA